MLAPPAVVERALAPPTPVDADLGQHEMGSRQRQAGPLVPTTTPHELSPSRVFHGAITRFAGMLGNAGRYPFAHATRSARVPRVAPERSVTSEPVEVALEVVDHLGGVPNDVETAWVTDHYNLTAQCSQRLEVFLGLADRAT
jgi:hypothetical protein